MKHAAERPIAKRIVAAVTAIAAAVALGAGGTLAYFSASEQAHNVITTGGVGIVLNEWGDLDRTEPFEDVEGVMPGESVVKVVEVENEGQAPAWVRVKVDVLVTSAGEEPEELSDEVLCMDWNMVMWTQGEDGWWYYNLVLEPGESTFPLFNEVTLAGAEMGDPYQGCMIEIDVAAQAVQSDNNGETAFDAAGWPAV